MLSKSALFFFFLVMTWPILYTPFGQIGIAVLFLLCLLPCICGLFYYTYHNDILLPSFILFFFLFLLFLVGQLSFGTASFFQSFRFCLLPFVFYSGYFFGSQLFRSNVVIRFIIYLIQIFFLVNIFVIFLSFISPSFARLFSLLYGQGDLYDLGYIAYVRYFGFSGQPASSAHTAVFLFFLMNFLLQLLSIRSHFIFPTLLHKIMYFVSSVSFIFLVVATASRSSMLCFGLSLAVPLICLLIYSVFCRLTISRSIILVFGSLSFLCISFFQSALSFLSSFYARYDLLFSTDTLFQRFGPYFYALDAHASNIWKIMFGFFLNTGYSLSVNPALYYTDSFFAFVFSHTGVIGLLVTAYILYLLLRLCISSSYLLKQFYISPVLVSPFSFSIYLISVSFLDPPLLESRVLFIIGSIVSVLSLLKCVKAESFAFQYQFK